MDLSIFWGAAFSIATSIAKSLGLPDKLSFLINLVAGIVYCGILIMQGQPWKQAVVNAVIAVGTSYGVYKTLGAPVRDLINPAAAELKKNGGS